MIELFYFSSLDLLIKVKHIKATNALCYASHRELDNKERVMAEQYILAKVAPKTDYYFKHPAMFVYLGVNKDLQKRLSLFHQESDTRSLRRKEREINASVNSLINASMRNYYTEKIGELIMAARGELEHGRQQANLKMQMNDLLQAYNVYSDQKVTLHEIIPSELKPFWPGLQEARNHMIPSQS